MIKKNKNIIENQTEIEIYVGREGYLKRYEIDHGLESICMHINSLSGL